jgi:diacylglycerol kinase (ATP)
LLIGSVLLVLLVELINSAIEAVVDRISSERHPLSGRAKDMGSAAVFIALMIAGFCWFEILRP